MGPKLTKLGYTADIYNEGPKLNDQILQHLNNAEIGTKVSFENVEKLLDFFEKMKILNNPMDCTYFPGETNHHVPLTAAPPASARGRHCVIFALGKQIVMFPAKECQTPKEHVDL